MQILTSRLAIGIRANKINGTVKMEKGRWLFVRRNKLVSGGPNDCDRRAAASGTALSIS